MARFLTIAASRSLAVRLLACVLPNPARQRGLAVDLGPGIAGWLRVSLTGFMTKTLPGVLGHPIEAVAFSRFGGFHRDGRCSDFQNPESPSYQCWYGAYLVFDNEYRQRFGFDTAGRPSPADALAALEADQRLVFRNAGIERAFPDGRLVRLCGELSIAEAQEAGQPWWRICGEADTWSTYHRGRLPGESWRFGWCYGTIPPQADHGVDDLHPLVYRGEFWLRYEEDWRATCCKFFLCPRYRDRQGRQWDKATAEMAAAGRAALAGVRFRRAGRA